MFSPLAEHDFLTPEFPEFDIAVGKLDEELNPSAWVQTLSIYHDILTDEKDFKTYLINKKMFVAGMGSCKECRIGGEFHACSQRVYFSQQFICYTFSLPIDAQSFPLGISHFRRVSRLAVATSAKNPKQHLVSFYPHNFSAVPYFVT